MAFGLTEAGYVHKRTSDVLSDLKSELRKELGQDVRVDEMSVFGQLLGVQAGALGEVWEEVQKLYWRLSIGDAYGEGLAQLARFRGFTPLRAERSQVSIRFAGDDGTVIPAGTIVRHQSTGKEFRTIEAGAIGAGLSVFIPAEAVEIGPVIAGAYTLTEIATPIAGVSGVENRKDAAPGRIAESDAELRARMLREDQSIGKATTLALLNAVRDVDGVLEVRIYENDIGDQPDAAGRPPRATEVAVIGGDAEAIARAILTTKAAGSEMVSTSLNFLDESIAILDEQGNARTIRFSRVAEAPITVEVDVTAEYALEPGELQAIADKVVRTGLELRIGDSVATWRFARAVGPDTVAELDEILDVAVRTARGSDAPDGANIDITDVEIARLAPERVTVTQVSP